MLFPLVGVYTAGAPLNNLSTVIDHVKSQEYTVVAQEEKDLDDLMLQCFDFCFPIHKQS